MSLTINSTMFSYELFISISSDIPAQGVKSIFKKINELITKNCQGSIKKSEYLGVKKLAYKIKKYPKARMYIVYFNTKSTNIHAMSSYLNINDGVVRSLITKIEKISDQQSQLFIQSQGNTSSDDKEYQKACDASS